MCTCNNNCTTCCNNNCTTSCNNNCTTSCNDNCTNCCNNTDPCAEQPCGCEAEVDTACVRYSGDDLACIGLVKGTTLEQFLINFNTLFCDIVPAIDGESAYQIWINLGNVGDEQAFINSLAGQSIDHVSFTSTTGVGQGESGETDTYTVWGNVGETISLGTFLVKNGDDGNGIANIVWTSNTSGAINTPGGIDTYTITFTDSTTSTFTVYNGLNANTDYGKTVWVDKVFGNNTTGLRERFDLPFLTYAGARAVAVAGDTVRLRPGTYVEDIILKNGVNVHCENKVIIQGSILDNGVAITSTFSGNANITAVGDAISSTGIGSNLNISVDTISTPSTAILVRPGINQVSTVIVKCRKITALSVNYFVTIVGNPIVTVIVEELAETVLLLSSPFSGLHLRQFEGKFTFSCPKVIIGNTTQTIPNIFLLEENGTTGGTSFIDVDEVINNSDYAGVGVIDQSAGTISKKGFGKIVLNIKNLTCKNVAGITLDGGGGLLVFKGSIYSSKRQAVRNCSISKLVIKESTLHRGSEGTDKNEVVALGDYNVNTFGGIVDNMQTELINTIIVKTSVGTDLDGGIISLDGASSTTLIKDCDIISRGTFTGFACKGAARNAYFKNVRAINTLSGVTQTEVGANGFTGSDVNLVTFDTIN